MISTANVKVVNVMCSTIYLFVVSCHHVICSYIIIRREMAQVLRQLLSVCPADFVGKKDRHDWSPLHILANNRDSCGVKPGMIAMLCRARADVNVTKGKGMTPLMCAVSTAHVGAADVLVLQGADINQENDEGTTAYDMTWHNRTMREWVSAMGSGEGAGVSGTGRLSLICRFGDKPDNFEISCKAF